MARAAKNKEMQQTKKEAKVEGLKDTIPIGQQLCERYLKERKNYFPAEEKVQKEE